MDGTSRLVRVAWFLVAGLWPAAVVAAAGPSLSLDLDAIRRAPASVVLDAPDPGGGRDVAIERDWAGSSCRARVVNRGKAAVRIKEVVVFDVAHAYPPETHLYGEGFTMLTETGGTVGKPLNLGYSDSKHYKIPQAGDATTVYGLLTLGPPGGEGEGEHALLAFTSCRRFMGRFEVRPASIRGVLDAEGLRLEPGQSWELEGLAFGAGPDRNALLAGLGEQIAANHPPLRSAPVPTGWCSWYCFGPRVKAEQVLANLDVIARDIPALRYIQLDDGYQPAMGDWLETGPAFGGGVRDVLGQIRRKGFEPALWVAPFIAEEGSHLFRQHPDWFMKDEQGRPLGADRVTFPGWRRGPWYALDGTHPEVQRHFEDLFRTLRRDWGCTYFKLDANFWGAMHGGKFHDPDATRIEAYRRGMEAILRGAGDAFVLGCNHPIWPSLGLVHGSRSSGDIKRTWKTFAATARMNLSRNWQNGRLWWNDPDCVVLTGDLSDDEYRFHATAIHATGGMLLSGDDLTRIAPERLAMLRKLVPPTGNAAEFADDALRVGRIKLDDRGRHAVTLLNWDEAPQSLSFSLPRPCRIEDFWTGADLGRHEGTYTVRDLPAHSARLLVCEPSAP